MKRGFVTVVLAVLFVLNAAAQGIEFFHGTWPEALAKAKAEEKLIFVDAFASWCGPCKKMASAVFPEKKAGDFYNANFINLKIDMEKPENADFASKYPVSAYPTLMVIDGEGKIVQKVVGGQSVDGLINFGQKALGGLDRSGDFEEEYNKGNRDPEFLLKYIAALNKAGKPSLKITNEYLNQQQDLATPFNLRFILEGAVEADSRVFSLLLKHREAIARQEGAGKVSARIELACKNTVNKAVEFRNEALLEEAKTNMKSALPERAAAFVHESDLRYYVATKDVKNYLKTVSAYQKSEVKNNAARLHDLVIEMLRAFPEEPKVLGKAKDWAQIAAENGGLPEYYLTLASICKELGKKDQALKAAQKARQAIGDKDNGMGARIDYFIQSLDEKS